KPLTASGLQACGYDSGRRSRSTGKLRDNETGLDFFEARYFSSAQGRFTIPDWSAKEEPVPYAKLEDPQSLNLYAYVQNNPLSRFDADGHCDSGGHADLQGPCPPPPKTPDPAGVRQNISQTPNSQSQQKPAAGNQTAPKASVGERVSMGVEAVANTVVGLPKSVNGAAAVAVGTLGSEIGVGVGVAVAGAYDLVQGSGQLTSAFVQAGGAITGNTAGVDEKVDQISASTSIAGAMGTALNGGDYHAGAKWAAAEGVFSGSLRQDLFKGLANTIDTILNTKDLMTP
ncbi:MAG: RHS repeat-associated core domain-containing protein, partial [Bryobacteraceae bacterium]